MKVINTLQANEINVDKIVAIYTGTVPNVTGNTPRSADRFEALLPERIIPQELVLHELNLLQNGFTFWVKIQDARSGEAVWVPARIDP